MPLEIVIADLTWIHGVFCENVGVVINTSTGIIEGIYDNIQHVMEHAPPHNIETIRYLKNKALIPGLINCHSHSFQRGLRGFGEEFDLDQEDNFWSWRERMYDLVSKCTKKEFYDLVYQCFYEMRRSGITSVGEFHYFHHSNATDCDYSMDDIVLSAAHDVGIRIVLLQTYYRFSGCGDKPILNKQRRFYTPSLRSFFKQMEHLQSVTAKNPLQTVGIVAHSIRAANIEDIVKLHSYSVEKNMVMHMHVDEQMNEVMDCKKHNQREPTALLLKHLDQSCLNNLTSVHNTLTDKKDMNGLIASNVKICLCPLTESNLGDGIFNLELDNEDKEKQLIGNLCVGTDCNERIDLFEELRMLEYSQRLKKRKRGVYANKARQPDISKVLFDIATVQGSNALQLNNGQIAQGKWSDLVCIDLSAMSLKGWTKKTLLASIIFGASAYEVVSDSCIHGQWVHYDQTSGRLSKL
eukprot:228833_1